MLSTVFLQGCSEARSEGSVPETASETVSALIPESPLGAAAETSPADAVAKDILQEDGGVRFSDILAQYQALNERLDNVAARLQSANAPLCPLTLRDPGYTVHTLSDYPEQLQQVAEVFLNVDKRLSVRTVRDGSSADLVGLQAGDRLVGINGLRFPNGLTQQKFYDRVTETAYNGRTAELTIARNQDGALPEVLNFELTPETICGYPAHVVFDEYVNGHTDGHAVWITSELMRTVEDDVNLALIVAHEMAHAISGDIDLDPTNEQRKLLELKADSMALVMLERAGFDIDQAIGYWMRPDNPQRQFQSQSETHPKITQRLENFESAKASIEAAKRKNEPLDFSILPESKL